VSKAKPPRSQHENTIKLNFRRILRKKKYLEEYLGKIFILTGNAVNENRLRSLSGLYYWQLSIVKRFIYTKTKDKA